MAVMPEIDSPTLLNAWHFLDALAAHRSRVHLNKPRRVGARGQISSHRVQPSGAKLIARWGTSR
jgi:hypothetical protein